MVERHVLLSHDYSYSVLLASSVKEVIHILKKIRKIIYEFYPVKCMNNTERNIGKFK